MRNMSFSMTLGAFCRQQKTVTRRTGWRFLKPGDELQGVVKSMGLRKGEKLQRLSRIRVLDVRLESLEWTQEVETPNGLEFSDYARDEVEKEGFAHRDPERFYRECMPPRASSHSAQSRALSSSTSTHRCR